MSFAKPEKKNDYVNEDDKLYCSHAGCPNLWSVRMEGSPPRCSYHHWGNKPKSEGTSTYKQWSERQNLSAPATFYYDREEF